MSDTPETDNFIVSAGYVRTDHQWRTFARKLERERDEALKTAAMWEKVALREASINGSLICGKEAAK